MLEPVENQYMQIGYIARSHGVNGEVMILSNFHLPELFDEINLVNLQNSRGDLFPARIEQVRVQEHKDRLSFFVKFDQIADRTQAEQLKDSPVYVDRAVAESLLEDRSHPADYTSFEVFNSQEQQIGTVEQVIDNPAHPILVVNTGDHRQLMIPFVDHFVRDTDTDQQAVYCRNLNELNDL